MNFERLREKILDENYPSEEELEETRQKYREISDFIEDEFSRETHFAGSSGRGTCMKGDRDIDIFVLFPEETGRQELEDRGLEIGKKVFDKFSGEHEIEYAEHPYTRGVINGHEVEIVPCYEVGPENIKSAVDRTPHHSRWVKENLDEEQRRDVVLLKTFLRAADIYGSSLKTRGFSGYLCEVLVAHYGGFRQLVEAAVDWREDELIDPEDHHEKLPEKLEEKFEDEPFVVIDPVDPERNVASVLSRENFARFIYRCWKFQQEPGIHLFEEEDLRVAEFDVKHEIEQRGDFLVIEFDRPEGVEDVVYPQMRKTLSRFEDVLENRNFRLFESGFHVGDEKTRLFFELDRKLPEVEELQGPKVFHGSEHIEQFTSKYDNTFVKDDRVYAKTEREFTDAKEYMKHFLSGELEQKGIPGRVAAELQDYSFVNAASGTEEWLKYLAKKLRIRRQE
ncbi:MAG: CCA tRNA nucleotidyltransferase, partial [Candidatus Nanohaloarchaea archaeon]